MRSMSAALVALLLALVVAGCGAGSEDSSTDFKGAQRPVAAAVEELEDAGSEDEGSRICARLLAKSLLDRLEKAGTNCRTAVDEALDDADNFAMEVDKVTIKGTTATANVTSGDGDQEKKDILTLEREGPRWKIASLGG